MLKRIIKKINYIFLMMVCCFFTTVGVSAADDTDKKTDDDIKLQTTILLDAKETTLRFILTNNSEKIIEIFPIMINNNRIIMTSPDGSKVNIALDTFLSTTNKVYPKTTVVWDVKVSDFFDLLDLIDNKKMGIYSLVWKVDKYTSNEVLCVKEEKKL